MDGQRLLCDYFVRLLRNNFMSPSEILLHLKGQRHEDFAILGQFCA